MTDRAKQLVFMIAAAAIAVTSSSSSSAQVAPTPAGRQHYERAEELYADGQYDRAIAEYQEAYRLTQEPELLFNIAQAHRLAQRPAEAAHYYRAYLEKEPGGRGSDAARKHLERLEPGSPASADERVVNEPTGAESPAASEPAGRTDRAAVEAGDEPAPPNKIELTAGEDPAAIPSRSERRRDGSGLRVAAAASLAGSLVAAGSAAWFTRRSASISDEINDFAGDEWSTALDRKVRQGRTAERFAIISAVTSGALLTGSIVLYYLGRTRGSSGVGLDAMLPLGGQRSRVSIVGRF